jgi:hypothetical protein
VIILDETNTSMRCAFCQSTQKAMTHRTGLQQQAAKAQLRAIDRRVAGWKRAHGGEGPGEAEMTRIKAAAGKKAKRTINATSWCRDCVMETYPRDGRRWPGRCYPRDTMACLNFSRCLFEMTTHPQHRRPQYLIGRRSYPDSAPLPPWPQPGRR